MDILYMRTGYDISRTITRNYSTSFFSAVNLLDKNIRNAIFSIYGFVRLADEIVDSFTGYDQENLLDQLEKDYREASVRGISVNPVVNSFELTIRKYGIDRELVVFFLKSMRMDLVLKNYTQENEIKEYIHGSAEAVGLMCLKIFVNGDEQVYEQLKAPAMSLGSAFQKVNFLRDLRADQEILSRNYFPGLNLQNFTEEHKQRIIREIKDEFKIAYEGIRLLPENSRLGVYMAYVYYNELLKKIEHTPVWKLFSCRIRIPNISKAVLFYQSLLLNKINWV